MALQRILGLDIGTTSIGFALIDYDRHAHLGEIVHLGVRIFQETLDAKTKVTLNQHRREKRLTRRQVRRRKLRRRELNELLYTENLLPKFGTSEWDSIMCMDPYVLRSKGTKDRLERYELGRVIYHLAKRRHFRGREEDVGEQPIDEETDSQQKANRVELLQELKKSGKTLGEYLAEIGSTKRKRNHLASREAVLDEFNRLMEQQSKYHVLSELRDRLRDVIFNQKPVFWRKNTLGTCRFNPESELCPSGSWLAQQRKLLETINNITIEGNNQFLTSDERDALVEACSTLDGLTWPKVKKTLKPYFENHGDLNFGKLKFNLEVGGLKKLPGNQIERELRKIFGSEWPTHPNKDVLRKNIFNDLFECDYRNVNNQRIEILRKEERESNRLKLEDKLKQKFQVSDEQAKKLASIAIKTGWEPYATETLEAFLTNLKDGHRMGDLLNSEIFSKWRDETFPNQIRATNNAFKQLPSPKTKEERERLRQIKNPTVVRTQNELRKVVNNLIRAYGKPDLIRVELARDLRNSKRRRKQIEDEIKLNSKYRDEARKDLIEKSIANPSRTDIQKWLLWKECQHICPYTGRTISFAALFGPNPTFEIEHIFPRSRSADDSMANKTLCASFENKEKGNRTPFEYLHENEDRWVQLTNRLDSMRKTGIAHGMSNAKIRRFKQQVIPDDFVNRQLVDTSYASLETIKSLKRLWSDEENNKTIKVQAVKGRATSQMRHLWGLDGILSSDDVKTRDDHRHHAIDALTVACIDPTAVAAILKIYYMKEDEGMPSQLQSPWVNVRRELAEKLEQITISHKVRKKASGSLHEETIFGVTSNPGSAQPQSNQYVTRKAITTMSQGEKSSIRDAHVRRLVMESTSGSASVITIGSSRRVVEKARYTVKQDPHLMKKVSTGYARLGENHHMSIFKNSIGKVEFSVVSLLDVANRIQHRRPIVDRIRENCEFINSFVKSDSILIPSGERKGVWIVNSIWASGQLVLTRHTVANAKKSQIWRPTVNRIFKLGFTKLSVDPIGRVQVAND